MERLKNIIRCHKMLVIEEDEFGETAEKKINFSEGDTFGGATTDIDGKKFVLIHTHDKSRTYTWINHVPFQRVDLK